jgi:hypothetical protein
MNEIWSVLVTVIALSTFTRAPFFHTTSASSATPNGAFQKEIQQTKVHTATQYLGAMMAAQ